MSNDLQTRLKLNYTNIKVGINRIEGIMNATNLLNEEVMNQLINLEECMNKLRSMIDPLFAGNPPTQQQGENQAC